MDQYPTGTELDIEDSDDGEEEEVISESSLSGDGRGFTKTRRGAARRHVLDVESDHGTQSQQATPSKVVGSRPKARMRFDIESESPRKASQSIEMGRKRRKMSISPAPLLGSPDMRDVDGDVPGYPYDAAAVGSGDGAPAISVDDGEDLSIVVPNSKVPQQPVFQQAPRFTSRSTEDALSGPPAEFSPQRRGERFIPGGMAAQLQGWLSEIKGWEEDEKAASATTIHVEQIRPGKRMYLVQGRAHPGETPKKWILAGEGKLTGLGKRAEVKMGSVVLIEQPTWDVELEGSIWNVACEWSVEQPRT
ncbi:methionyl-trna formyltransferase [Trichoderma cornu-damae]|uniref:Methionyl-trna formyltransferase n=1 Tax=Trichoderma cornu-damae TaxID=654480 RepID=A0A9P8QGL0_9HYPO|nr:methionyl-trna formyltransferase [Trichoderma cornu-damae]